MKRILLAVYALGMTIAVNAQQWIDITDKYVKNPYFNGDDYSYWEGTPLSGRNAKNNAEHYYRAYDTYQEISGLKPGKYRVSLKAFYSMGSIWEDYELYITGNYAAQRHAQLYATSSIKNYTTPIVPLSSGRSKEAYGGSCYPIVHSENGNYILDWWLPYDLEAADAWFAAGYYDNSVECEVAEDGKLKIGIRKMKTLTDDWTCLDDWKLEIWDYVTPATDVKLDLTTATMIPWETKQLTATVYPEEASFHKVAWKSSDEDVAFVDRYGNVTALSVGTAVITATTIDGSDKTAECTLTVEAPVAATSENVKINEIMAANVDVYRDPSTNFGSWVELYNPTDKGVDLGGLYVTDDVNNLKKHRLIYDYDILPAHSFAILNFDHFEIYTYYSYRQIDDKLDCDGGTIIVSDGENILAEVTYPEAISRVSYARTTDGGEEWGTTDNPTPGASNATSTFATKQLKMPEVDTPAKLFKGTLDVNVTIPEGATLRYTTDGTAPTLKNGNTSTDGKFTVSGSVSYRFRLFQDGMLASPVATRTYIRDNGNEPFPIISIVTDLKNISKGEYALFKTSSYGRPGNGVSASYNGNMDWDRPVNFEYITTKNECVISQECDYSMCGGWSRTWEPHSFKLKAGKTYEGNNTFAYQFFGSEKDNPAVENGKGYLKHKTLQIRNGGNDNECRIMDAAIQQIVTSSGLYVEHQAWQPVHVYINASPYAVLNMREPNNKHYGYSNYGIDTDLMDQFEISPDSGYVQKAGTKDAFNKWYDLAKTASSEDSYKEICKLVDIDEFVNYMAVELYLGSDDWPHNNVKAFRDQNDGKFRFVLFDLDFAMNRSKPFDDFFTEQYYKFNTLMGSDYAQYKSLYNTNITQEIELVTIFKNMLGNDTFRKKFIDAFCLVSGSVFEPTRVKEIVNSLASYLKKGKYVNPESTANTIKNGLSGRQARMLTQLKNCSYLNLDFRLNRMPLHINRNRHYHVIACIPVFLWKHYIIFNLKHLNVSLLFNKPCDIIYLRLKAAYNSYTGNIINVLNNIRDSKFPVIVIHLLSYTLRSLKS